VTTASRFRFINDAQWELNSGLLPSNEGRRGDPFADDRPRNSRFWVGNRASSCSGARTPRRPQPYGRVTVPDRHLDSFGPRRQSRVAATQLGCDRSDRRSLGVSVERGRVPLPSDSARDSASKTLVRGPGYLQVC
jgi:hypothetical protein